MSVADDQEALKVLRYIKDHLIVRRADLKELFGLTNEMVRDFKIEGFVQTQRDYVLDDDLFALTRRGIALVNESNLPPSFNGQDTTLRT